MRSCCAVQRAKTDAFEGLEFDNPERPESRNLLTIYQCVTGMSQVCEGGVCDGLGYG